MTSVIPPVAIQHGGNIEVCVCLRPGQSRRHLFNLADEHFGVLVNVHQIGTDEVGIVFFANQQEAAVFLDAIS